ncbi:MAG: hypothetical protein ACE3JK_11620 [Sporolactobacillus sp.]
MKQIKWSKKVFHNKNAYYSVWLEKRGHKNRIADYRIWLDSDITRVFDVKNDKYGYLDVAHTDMLKDRFHW